MSYDIYLRPPVCPACKRPEGEYESIDPTWNLSPIFHLALTGRTAEADDKLPHAEGEKWWGVHILNGRKAGDTLAELNAAVDRLSDEKLAPQFRALEPENGWGTAAGAREIFTTLRRWASEHPTWTWEVR